LSEWERITEDKWVLDAVSGYRIDFIEQPYQDIVPNEIPFSDEEWYLVDEEVKTLLNKGAIVQSWPEDGEFISNLFLVPKSNGKMRPIINLKKLNNFVTYHHFKQETFGFVLDLIQKNDYMSSIDLQDAYFSIPIHEDDQKYLKFVWDGKMYMFVCLPFGISIAPFLFTKLLKPVYAWLRQQGIRCSYYIDDSLGMDQDMTVCKMNTVTMAETLQNLGYVVNEKKSVFVPTQRIVFFGFVLDSVQFKVFLTEEKVSKIIAKGMKLLETETVSVRQLASFIGMLINAFYAVLEAPLHYRILEKNKLQGLGATMNFDNKVQLWSDSKLEVQWWIENVRSKNGKVIRPTTPSVVCRTDASFGGWGTVELDTDRCANGRWRIDESQHSINVLELLAIFYALQSLYVNFHDTHIEIQSDNITAISYVNAMGGMTSDLLNSIAKDIWEWCLARNIFVTATHVPGVMNTADYYSRNFSDATEWTLKQDIFERICYQFFRPEIDLFASRLNNQVEQFVSWFPEPGAIGSDAFSMSWQDMQPYIFPPFNIVGRVVNKIVQDKVEKAILVFPFWRSQTWFPLILANLVDFPVRLPRHLDLLTLAHNGMKHPLRRSITMVAATLSGMPCRTKAFQQKLAPSSLIPGEQAPENSMIWHGGNGVLGAYQGKLIPLFPLKLVKSR